LHNFARFAAMTTSNLAEAETKPWGAYVYHMQAKHRLQGRFSPAKDRPQLLCLVATQGDRMRTKARALFVAMSMTLAIMAPAKADTFNTTPLDMFPGTVPGAQFSFISNSFTTGGTSFDDLWTFDISGNGSQGTGSASSLSTRITGFTIDQTPIQLELRLLAWDGAGYGTILSDSGPSIAPTVQASLAANTGGAPGHGFYALEVLGATPVGAVITQYAGQLQVAAVPEPSTYAVLLGGMVLLAAQIRGRSI
jgi:hypothetical protein